MSTSQSSTHTTSTRTRLLRIGVTLMIVGAVAFVGGLVATQIWAAYVDSGGGPDSFQIATVQEAGDDGTWKGYDEQGNLIWEGTQEEFAEIDAVNPLAITEQILIWVVFPGLVLLAVGAVISGIAGIAMRPPRD